MSEPSFGVACKECGHEFIIPVNETRVWEITNGSLSNPPDTWLMLMCKGCRQWLCEPIDFTIARQFLAHGALHTAAQTPPIMPDAVKVKRSKDIQDDEILDFMLDLEKKSNEEVWEALMSGS